MSKNILNSSTGEPLFVVAAIISPARSTAEVQMDQVLIVRRGPRQSGSGRWEFPGGKVETGETPEAALRREIREELGIEIDVGELLGEEIHAYRDKTIRLRVYLSQTAQLNLSLHEHDASLWVLPGAIPTEQLSAADRPFVQKLIDHLGK